MKFTAATRATQGTSASRRLRREAKVPAILYGLNQPAAMIAIDHNEMFYALQKEKFHSSILTMELDGTEQLVVLRAFQMHPYKNQVLHMDFQRIDPNANVNQPPRGRCGSFLPAQGSARIHRRGSLRHDQPDHVARGRHRPARRRDRCQPRNPGCYGCQRCRRRRRRRQRCSPGSCYACCLIAQFVASTAVPFSKKRGRTQPKPVLCRRHPLGAAAENGFFRYLRFSERFDLRPIA